MHEELWQRVVDLDPCVMAERTACAYHHPRRRFTVPLCGQDYHVCLAERSIRAGAAGNEAGYPEQLAILSYLLHATDQPLADRLVKPEQLEAGQFFFRGHHVLPTEKLVAAFGGRVAALIPAAKTLGATAATYGDAAAVLHVLPRLPVTFVVWAADEEFPARASILFDATAADQLPLDAIQVAVGLAVKALIAAAG